MEADTIYDSFQRRVEEVKRVQDRNSKEESKYSAKDSNGYRGSDSLA